MRELGIPGVAVGIVQDGKVVFADGFGVRELGKPEKPDGNTLFMIASNTKALTTLMLAKLVDAHRFGWETPVASLLPPFKLGDSATTRQVLVKHLVCACTGLPRQDVGGRLEFKHATPDAALRPVGPTHPPSHHAVRPARAGGAAWRSVRDILKYISSELAEGRLPDGTQYIHQEPLLQRRAPNVPLGKEATYGMGLMVDTKYGTPVVHHGGDLIGFHSDMMWLPEQRVGAVVLTNGNPGWVLRDVFQRKLLEVLFDGRAEADADVAAQAKNWYAQLAADRRLLTVPADTAESAQLARHFHNDALGDIDVRRAGGRTVFDFGEFRSEVATRKNPDGSISFLTIAPGIGGFEFVVSDAGKRLTIRDAQHEYVFTGVLTP